MLARLIIICFLAVWYTECSIANTIKKRFEQSEQLGAIISRQVLLVVEKGYSHQQAIDFQIKKIISEESSQISEEHRALLALDLPITEEFFLETLKSNTLVDATKVLVEGHPEELEHIITLSTTLFPDFVREIFNGVLITGALTSEELKESLEKLGIDKETVSLLDIKMVSPPISTALIAPLGAGVGSGGTGSGDLTVSSN